MTLYTVKEISELAHVTIKTLHHYHKIGLLVPCERSAAGYRLYSQADLERLQEILFFRELDFSLEEIREHMANHTDRVSILTGQRGLLLARIRRLERLVQTVDESIDSSMRSEKMDNQAMFAGLNADQWGKALKDQADYLKDKYGFDLLAEKLRESDATEMNVMALEASKFQQTLAQALRDGVSHQDERITTLLADHMAFLNQHGHQLDAQGLLTQARFLTGDEFHRKMMEGMQIGLAYYYLAAVEAFAG